MTRTTTLAAPNALRLLSPLAVLIGATMLLGACSADPKMQSTTTEQTTVRQTVPSAMPTSTTTTTKTQQYVP
jgi:uncharacterized lipoprotein YajG